MAPPEKSGRRRSNSESSSVSGARARARQFPRWRQRVGHWVDQKSITILMTIFTIYALFGDDIRLATVNPSGDDVFFGLSAIALFLFTAELILNSIGKQNYLLGFYFWLDALATLSLIPDIGWIWSEIVKDDNSPDATGAVKAGRASRAGTRAGRIVRIVRLVRLIRIAKLYKHVRGEEAHKQEQELLGDHVDGQIDGDMGQDDEMPSHVNDVEAPPVADAPREVDEPSAVGKHLSDLTTRRVILLVLAMIILIPVFDVNTYVSEEDEAQIYGIEATHLTYFAANRDTSDALFQQQLRLLADSGELMHVTINEIDMASVIDANPNIDGSNLKTLQDIDDDFRSNEAPLASSSLTVQCYDTSGNVIAGTCSSFAFFNAKSKTRLEAWLNVCKTIFVMIVLAAGAILFTRDAETIVIGPIERMVTIVKKLADDPLAAIKDGRQMEEDHQKDSQHSYETRLLEKTLTKVSGLLQIGFGEAGAEIISQNLKSGALNPLLDGKMITAVFGFCDIRQFTDTTECLQAQVMVFVNQVGGLVHFATSQYGGSVNKNIGDAFLLAWKLNTPPDAPADREALLGTPMAADPNQYSYSPALQHRSGAGAGAGAGAGGGRSDAYSTPPPKSKKPLRSSLGRAAAAAAARDSESKHGVLESKAQDSDDLNFANPMHMSPASPASTGRGQDSVTRMSDSALFAFLKIIVDVENSNRIGILRQWQDHPAVRKRFKDKFWVRMGFGLHTGWAVEGAIGSRYKIDASYLSPNVNMASRLEAATKQFRTPLLISQKFWQNLSMDAKAMTRCIDCVTVKGSEEPIKLYAVDVTHIPKKLGINESDMESDLAIPANRHVSFAHSSVKSLQKGLHPAFFPTFKRATDAYFDGDFTACRTALEEGLKLKPDDGPTKTLMEVLESFNFIAPASWRGFRELTEK